MTDDMVTTERVGIVVSRLMDGESGTTMEIAGWIGLQHSSTWQMLDKLSRVLPIVFVDGHWKFLNVHLLQCDADD